MMNFPCILMNFGAMDICDTCVTGRWQPLRFSKTSQSTLPRQEAPKTLTNRYRTSMFASPFTTRAVSNGPYRCPSPRRELSITRIEVDLEIPTHVLVGHSPWNQLQELARLDGPNDATPSVASIDGVRRFAVAVAAKMARAHEGFGRHARLLASPFVTDAASEHTAALEKWLASAEQSLIDARGRLREADASPDVAREALLADEYLSHRLLELLAGAETTLAAVYDQACNPIAGNPASNRLASAAPLIAIVGERLADGLTREMDHRARAGYLEADADAPLALERYLDRASRLKKHFQEVLFLEAERFAVTDRLHHWVAGGVAIVASTWAFVAQLYLTRGSMPLRLSSSIVMLCVLAGVVYAVKDRIKEIGRVWFAANVHRFYAQRIARYRAPIKTCPSRDVVVRARESFVADKEARPDPLAPESGAKVSVTTLRYRHLGTLESSRTLAAAGMSRVKHVFRYDVSPIFARLDDATKPVPTYDTKAQRTRFTQAPRCYRVPVRVIVGYGRLARVVQSGDLIVHKRGLERIELT